MNQLEGAVQPFLKWAGGKRWFAWKGTSLIPTGYNRYIEPFVGSGALFFSARPQKGILADLNEDLIVAYRAVRDDPGEVGKLLEQHQSRHSKEYYYEMRAEKPTDEVGRAAWLIYLNRTCWNGLYRVNKKNEFNVPIGTKSSVVLPTDDFLALSRALRRVEIECADFEVTIDGAGPGDFVFVDPPYTVKHNLNGFVKYNDKIFSWSDQIRLRDAVDRAAGRGAMILITNANHDSVRELYADLGRMTTLSRASVLAADRAYRSAVEELVVQTWLDPE